MDGDEDLNEWHPLARQPCAPRSVALGDKFTTNDVAPGSASHSGLIRVVQRAMTIVTVLSFVTASQPYVQTNLVSSHQPETSSPDIDKIGLLVLYNLGCTVYPRPVRMRAH